MIACLLEGFSRSRRRRRSSAGALKRRIFHSFRPLRSPQVPAKFGRRFRLRRPVSSLPCLYNLASSQCSGRMASSAASPRLCLGETSFPRLSAASIVSSAVRVHPPISPPSPHVIRPPYVPLISTSATTDHRALISLCRALQDFDCRVLLQRLSPT